MKTILKQGWNSLGELNGTYYMDIHNTGWIMIEDCETESRARAIFAAATNE